jgi:protease II
MLLKTDMSSGHFSASDRYKLMEERSIEFAFVANELGCTKLLSATGK